MSTLTLQQAFDLAVRHHQQGRLAEAESLLRQILSHQADHADAIQMLGVLAWQAGRAAEAIELIRAAIALNPEAAHYYSNLGMVLATTGKSDEALLAFEKAMALDPGVPEVHNNRGNVLKDQGRWDEAAAAYRRAVALRPQYVEVIENLVKLLRQMGRREEAIAVLGAAPDVPEIHNERGNLLQSCGQLDEAIAEYRKALAQRPAFAEALGNLGSALSDNDRLDEAVAAHRQAIALRPDLPAFHCNLANALKESGLIDEAIASYRRAVALRKDAQAADNLLYSLYFHPDYDSARIFQEHAGWNQAYALPLKGLTPPRHPEAAERLRIGYVSADFRSHSQSLFTTPLLAHHDHAAYEIFCYSDVVNPDVLTERLRGYADVWRNIAGMSDEQAAELIRRDQIDILVDLTLHMSKNRLLVFARKPAPLQVTWLGYPGTTGLQVMDYRFSDPCLDPDERQDIFYSEKTIRLAETFWCYDPLTEEPAVNELPALKAGCLTFGCLNNFSKVNDFTLELWSNVLRAVPRSRLLVLAPHGSARQRVLDQMKRVEDAEHRVEFLSRLPRRQYLELYRRIDIGLDTFPCPGHTTTLDALWMGVPVVTLPGPTAVGRGGVSILTNLGLGAQGAGEGMIARTVEEYVKIVCCLADNLPRLSELRTGLRGRMERSPLMDARRFARNMEAAFRGMWHASPRA